MGNQYTVHCNLFPKIKQIYHQLYPLKYTFMTSTPNHSSFEKNWPPFLRWTVQVRCAARTTRQKLRNMMVKKEKDMEHWRWYCQIILLNFWDHFLLFRVTDVSWGTQRGFSISLSGMLFEKSSLKHIIYILTILLFQRNTTLF